MKLLSDLLSKTTIHLFYTANPFRGINGRGNYRSEAESPGMPAQEEAGKTLDAQRARHYPSSPVIGQSDSAMTIVIVDVALEAGQA